MSAPERENWTVLDLMKRTADWLESKGIDTPRLDTELLLAFTLDTDRTHLYMNYDQPLNEEELSRFRELVKRRAAREPLQQITGHQEFWSMEFSITPGVLIPRPETELLVEEGAKEMERTFPGGQEVQILDIGTGSGALAVALAKEMSRSQVTGIDLSPEAVELSKKNAEKNGLTSSVRFLEGDLFGPIACDKFHLIVSNPPYIPTGDIEGLQPEVRNFEPPGALDGGPDGLDCYRRMVPESAGHLHPKGWLMVEHGQGQSEEIVRMFEETGRFEAVESINDLAGIDRVVKGRLK